MKEFEELLQVANQLLGPQGCPWDLKQTFFTLQTYLLEESHELLEAIDIQNFSRVAEELGDVLYTLIFIAKLGEKQGLFTLEDSVRQVKEKLIRRHPHIFGDVKIQTPQEIEKKWDEIKLSEGKKNPIADIPPSLPSLSRAQKIVRKMKETIELGNNTKHKKSDSHNALGYKLWELVMEAEKNGLDAESALRRTCQIYEKKFSED